MGVFWGLFMTASIRLTAAALAALMGFAAPAFAQLGAQIVPGDQFRGSAGPTPLAPVPAPRPAATPGAGAELRSPLQRPAVIPVAGSPLAEPTYDEGTLGRIAGAWQHYQDIASRGGWPVLPRTVRLAPGQTGVALRSADHEVAGRIDEELRLLV